MRCLNIILQMPMLELTDMMKEQHRHLCVNFLIEKFGLTLASPMMPAAAAVTNEYVAIGMREILEWFI